MNNFPMTMALMNMNNHSSGSINTSDKGVIGFLIVINLIMVLYFITIKVLCKFKKGFDDYYSGSDLRDIFSKILYFLVITIDIIALIIYLSYLVSKMI